MKDDMTEYDLQDSVEPRGVRSEIKDLTATQDCDIRSNFEEFKTPNRGNMSPLRDNRGKPLHKKAPRNSRQALNNNRGGLVIVESHNKYIQARQKEIENRMGKPVQKDKKTAAQTNSLLHFQQTELGVNFQKLFNDKKLPFKYRTLVCLQKILFCKEVEEDIQKFRAKESKIRRNWKFEAIMSRDINRTPILKTANQLHEDAKRIVEFYCYSHNVHYCQGMLEVLLPFLFMKSHESNNSPQTDPNKKLDPLNCTMDYSASKNGNKLHSLTPSEFPSTARSIENFSN